jgi:hypothetical protein
MSYDDIWYQANLTCSRKCETWRKDIAEMERVREQVSTSPYAEQLNQQSKQQLQDRLLLGGRDYKQMARTGNRQQMIAFLLDDKREQLTRSIAVLEKQIADNQPDPRWREREEEEHDAGNSTHH